MVAKQRLQMNFQVMRDELFSHLQHEFVLTPLTYVKRESVMTQEQVNQILGVLYIARKAKIGITVTFCVIGALLLALCVVMFLKSKRMARNESLGISEDENEEQQERPRDKYHNIIQNESRDPTSLGNTLIESTRNLNYLR